MDRENLLDKLWELSVVSGMNQRLHQADWTFYVSVDTWIKILVAITAAIAFIVAVFAAVAMGKEKEKARKIWDMSSIGTALLALVMAVVLNIVSPEHEAVYHADLFRRWSDLRREVDTLTSRVEEVSDKVQQDHTERFRELIAREADINALERSVSDKVLEEHLQAEERSRGGGTRPPSTPRADGSKTAALNRAGITRD